MGFLSKMFGRTETRAAVGDYLPGSVGIFGAAGFNDSGIAVTEANAVTCSAVWACVQIVSQAVASLPAHVITRDTGEKQYDHAVAKLLAEPNEYMTAAVFRETLLANALLWGFGIAAIVRDELGIPISLYPLRSSDTRPIRTPAGELLYQTNVAGKTHYLTPDQVLYLPGLSLDGITALSPITSARQTIGLALAMDRYAAKVFSNGGNVGGILKVPPMNDGAMKSFVASWRANYTGIDNALKVAVLPDGYDFKQTSMDPERGQMTASRTHQVLEVARYFRVPPHMLGVLDKASYASIEMQNLEFYQNTIQPHVTKLEQEANRKLLLEREKPRLEIRLNMDAMLRSTTQDRYTAYQKGRQGGWLSINDIRRKEGLPPVEGGDALLQPLNMTPVNGPAPKPAPDKTAARSLIEDAARRLLVKEGKALTRAAKKFAGKPAELRQWAETWYAGHRALVARILAPAIRAAGLDTEPDEYAAEHCAESVRQISAAIEAAGTAEDISDEWEAIRPAQIVDSLFDEDGGKRNAAA
jgi:HK97 family phage portal protein